MRRLLLIALVVGFLGAGVPSEAVRAQGATVRGRIVERTQGSWIGGAAVRLSGSPPYFTNLDGRFQFAGVAPGRHTLTVEAMGYRARSLELLIRTDTAMAVEMEPDPIVLDSLLVRAGEITIRGEIRDARDGQRVFDARVSVLPGFPAVRAVRGGFTVRRVPVGRAATVIVESLGFLPARIALITESDTTLTVDLEPDPVGLRMLAAQVQKLEMRSRSVPYSRRVIDQENLDGYAGWSVLDIVNNQLARFGRRGARLTTDSFHPCLFVDDVQQMHLGLLWSLAGGDVARIEIYDRGGMIRIYTQRFLVRTLGREPTTLVYIEEVGGLGPVCR